MSRSVRGVEPVDYSEGDGGFYEGGGEDGGAEGGDGFPGGLAVADGIAAVDHSHEGVGGLWRTLPSRTRVPTYHLYYCHRDQ